MSIDGTITGQFTANDRRTVGLNASANIGINQAPSIAFANGSGAAQANILYQASLALVAGVYNLDLNGAVTDSYGTTVSAVRIKAIYIKNKSASNNLTVGNATSPWVTFLTGTGTLILPPSAWIVAATPDATGWAVTATTGDILKFAGTGTDAFEVALLGAST